MNVILQQDVAGLGRVGDIVRVRDGYARNFLVPRGLAVIADERNKNRLAHQKAMAEAKAHREMAKAKELADKLAEVPVTVKREAGEDGKLFGSVTNRDIAEAYAAEGFELDRRSIILEEPIHHIGVFQVPVRLHREVEARLKVYVIQK